MQASPSLHAAVLFVCAHAAFGVPGFSHASFVQGLLSLQSAADVQPVQTFVPPEHAPAEHDSPLVQELLSLQEVPFGAVGFEHEPVEGLHVPAAWHWSLAVQTCGFDPVQTPPAHASVWVHALPSSHAAVLFVCAHAAFGVPGFWHVSFVQGLLSLQSAADVQPVQTFVPPEHAPAEHDSPLVQELLSLQEVPFGAVGFEHEPVEGLHVPAVWH